MVSQPIATQQKIPPLSYADRAKKAQNPKSPISLNSHPKPAPLQTAPNPALPPGNNGGSSASQPASDGVVKISVGADGANDVTVSPPRPTQPSPTSTDSSDLPMKPSIPNELSSKAPPVPAAQTAPQKASVNVWDVRKEQMAAARSAQQPNSHPPPSQTVSSGSSSLGDRSAAGPPQRGKSPHNLTSNGAHVGGPSATSSVNGKIAEDHLCVDDPFVVRIHKQPVPPSIDAESWPEVGKAAASTHHGSSGDTNHSHETAKEDREQQHAPANSRKSEKTKWVPIPVEELQAAADAHVRTSRHHPNHHSNAPPPRIANTNNQNAKESGSSHGLPQGKSRPHSVSHSRRQSRSGSLQSSPRPLRPRRLPPEDGQANGQRSNQDYQGGKDDRSSTTTSASGDTSPLVVKAHLQPRRHHAVSVSPSPHQHLPIQSQNQASYPASMYPQGPGSVLAQESFVGYDPNRPTPYPHYMHHPSAPGFQSSRDRTPPLPLLQPPYVYPQSNQGYPFYGPMPYGHSNNNRSSYDYSQIGTSQPSVPQAQYGYWNGYGHDSRPGSGYHSPVYAPPQVPQQVMNYAGYQQQDVLQIAKQEEVEHSGEHQSQKPLHQDAFAKTSSPAEETSPDAVCLDDVPGSGAEWVGERKVVFGSIGENFLPEDNPSMDNGGRKEGEEAHEKHFVTPVSIGVNPGEMKHLRSRSGTRTRTRSIGMSGTGKIIGAVGAGKVNAKVIDLTDAAEVKWEFGTATTSSAGTHLCVPVEAEGGRSSSPLLSCAPISALALDGSSSVSQRGSESGSRPSYTAGAISSGMNHFSTSSPSELHKRLEELSVSPPTPTHGDLNDPERDVFEVKNFGYGFGAGSRGSASPADPPREPNQLLQGGEGYGDKGEQANVDKEKERGKEGGNYQSREGKGGDGYGRPKRYGPSGGPSGNPERGSYGLKRKPSKGFRRGSGSGGGGYSSRLASQSQLGMAPPFTVTPNPALFRPVMPAMGGDLNTYYPPLPGSHMNMATYLPPGYEGYFGASSLPPIPIPPVVGANPPSGTPGLPMRVGHTSPPTPVTGNAPVPMPITPITFPLDPTRWYLLGQLEYYLSPENLAQDFFLRQQMDSRGWVQISLIGSFNRVRQLSVDMQVVKEVLSLSRMVEVKDDWVRMIGWEKFVLPDAPPSTVEEDQYFAAQVHGRHSDYGAEGEQAVPPRSGGRSEETEEGEDEDEVVIVMNQDLPRKTASWTHSIQT